MEAMKAWVVKNPIDFAATVVFARTAGKARVQAMYTEICEDLEFTEIQVRRAKEMDKYYAPEKQEMNWYDAADRVAMVKELGFSCDPDCTPDFDECARCPANEWCDEYQARKEEKSEND